MKFEDFSFEDYATKVAVQFDVPLLTKKEALTTQFKAQEKPLIMALNIPTFINLYGYGYGYRSVFELAERVIVNDPRITFEGNIVKK